MIALLALLLAAMSDDWWQLLLAGGGGAAITKLIDLIKGHDTNVWSHIGRLTERAEAQQAEIKLLRDAKHNMAGQLFAANLKAELLEREVNDLYRQSGKQPKYPDLDGMIRKEMKNLPTQPSAAPPPPKQP